MVALAAGAVWALIALWSGRPLVALAFVVAATIAATLAQNHALPRSRAALLAGALTVLACAYCACLTGSAEVAMMLGLPLRTAFAQIGPEMAFAVAWARATRFDLAVYTVAGLTAAWMVWRARR